MPTLVADVKARVEVVVSALLASGLHWRNPVTAEIIIWSSSGEQIIALSEADALELWHRGATLQLWQEELEDLAIGHSEDGVRLFFDGCTARDVAMYLTALINRQLEYSVGPED